MNLYRMTLTTTHTVLVVAENRDDAAEIAWDVADEGGTDPHHDTDDELVTHRHQLECGEAEEVPESSEAVSETRTVAEILMEGGGG